MTLQLRVYIGLVLFAGGVLAAGLLLRDRTVPFDSAAFIDQLDDDAVVARGAYLATAGNCAGCHTTEQGAALAGGHAFQTPFGVLHSTNITQDPEAGIGAWSLDDFARAMRSGKRPNGEHLYPAFPYTAYTQLEDADIAALFAYLRTIPADSTIAPDNDLRFPYSQRWLLRLWKALYLQEGPRERTGTDALQARGAYLVEALSHCSACHSPRSGLGAEREDAHLAGGSYTDHVPGGASVRWSAPNLTSDARGLGLWSEDEIAAYLRSGRNRHVEVFGPMRAVVLASTRHLSEDDQRAMARYLANVPARAEPTAPAADRRTLGRGRTVYNLHCGTCHLPTGEGDAEMAPRLDRGSLIVQDSDPAALLNVILYGPALAMRASGSPWRTPMDHYRYELDDEEIAAVATYVRNSWGNAAGVVLPAAVAAQRAEP